ncbi:glycoside hydrolase [Pseudozyma hubeiensis SY62]|uniref:Glycoside hydrolase n=1 Tax=Pseudozyma hubeiensis (strain SY62) TaxID=1305764 RepID=R9P4N1_PSEHS|nr:glycoside hydrolase [Pseudozyma hubeiensis SY62]GAC96207.1 glycoside hydrolase [Pseudozyma hubeiensis SY62]
MRSMLQLVLSVLAFIVALSIHQVSARPLLSGSNPSSLLTPLDLPFGQFGPAASQRGSGAPGSDNITEDASGLAPALAPGVTNSLGVGFDPQFLTVTRDGKPFYMVTDVDFGLNVFLRASHDLNDIYRDESKKHTIYHYPEATYPNGVGTEAADVVQYGDKFLYTVSAIADDTMRVLVSQSSDPLGNYTDLGRVLAQDGTPLTGYDPHVIVHPNGNLYLTWSNHEFVQIVQLQTGAPARAASQVVDLVSYGVNTEAPSSWIFDNRMTGSRTLNLMYAEGNYYQSNYNTRLLYIDVQKDPLDPTQWLQRAQPILASDSSQSVYGPGSGSLFNGPDGNVWCAYGAFASRDGADNGKNERYVRVQVAEPDAKGVWLPTQVVAAQKLD